MNLRENIETDHKSKAKDLGLSMIELSFYNILVSELGGEDEINETKSQQAKDVVKSLVTTLDEVTKIVDFFNKWDEQKRIKRDIKRIVIDKFDESLVKPVSERFMELAKVKFG